LLDRVVQLGVGVGQLDAAGEQLEAQGDARVGGVAARQRRLGGVRSPGQPRPPGRRYDDRDLADAGYAYGVADLVTRRVMQAREAGLDGLILSAKEVGAVRARFGRDMILVTPGIRPAGVAAADQKRTMTPGAAIAAGADYLVVGRPVTQAKNPREAAEAIIAEIAAVQS